MLCLPATMAVDAQNGNIGASVCAARVLHNANISGRTFATLAFFSPSTHAGTANAVDKVMDGCVAFAAFFLPQILFGLVLVGKQLAETRLAIAAAARINITRLRWLPGPMLAVAPTVQRLSGFGWHASAQQNTRIANSCRHLLAAA